MLFYQNQEVFGFAVNLQNFLESESHELSLRARVLRLDENGRRRKSDDEDEKTRSGGGVIRHKVFRGHDMQVNCVATTTTRLDDENSVRLFCTGSDDSTVTAAEDAGAVGDVVTVLGGDVVLAGVDAVDVRSIIAGYTADNLRLTRRGSAVRVSVGRCSRSG